jgi:hypothetical protein
VKLPSCAWPLTIRESQRWTTAVNVKLLLPPRQSRGTSYGVLAALDSPEPTRRQKARQIIRDTLAVNQKSWNDLITSLQFRGQHSDKLKKLFAMMENSVPARPIYVPRGKTHIGTCDEDRRTQHRILIRIVLQPSEELRNAIDLIIVTTVWK